MTATGIMPQPYVTSAAAVWSSALSSSGTVTKWYGDGPRQNHTSPLNSRSTAVSIGAVPMVTRVSGPYGGGMSEASELLDPHCPTCGQPLRHGGHLSRENAAFLTASGNAGVTFETQGRCENEACVDFGREFAPGEWLVPDDEEA